MTLRKLLQEYNSNWVRSGTVKIGNFYIVHIGDGILYCGTKKHMKQVHENNTFIYKLYEISGNKERFVCKLFNKCGYVGVGMFLAAMLEYGITTYTVLGLILGIVLVILAHLSLSNY